jgi:hypothetical protein
VLKLVAQEGLLKGNTIKIDATTLEANVALRSIVRRENGESYQEFLERRRIVHDLAKPINAPPTAHGICGLWRGQ